MAVIDPGAFRREMSLQQATVTGDGIGGHSESWDEVAKVFAHVRPMAAKAAFEANQSAESVSHRITIRARADLASGMRFVEGARIFEILTVYDPDETGRYLACTTREKGQ